MNFIDTLQSTLAQRPRGVTAEWEARPAAVLVPLYQHNEEWCLLFTQRTDLLNEHKGQVAFPGGRIDPDDASPEHAALREAEEEIGLKRSAVTVLGRLDDLITSTQWYITPVVGVFSYPYEFDLNLQECSAVFGVSLKWLADSNNLEMRYRQPPVGGPPIPVYYYRDYEGHTIWGVTARMVQMLLAIIETLGVK